MQSRSIGLTAALVIALCPYVEPPEAPAQSKDAKQATGSISGVVTSDGRPAPDVLVLFVKGPTGDLEAPTVGRTRSDKEGRFVFRGLERGSYGVDAYSPGMFVIDQSSEEGAVAVSVTDGEEVKNVEISLVKGCTITGKLIDEHGNLIASQRICVFAKLPSGKFDPVKTWETRVASDDRGVYRVFGLPPGAYAVGAGRVPAEGVERMSPALWHAFDRRFHGGSSTPDDARLVEIANGAEAQGIDIVLKRAADGYRIRGRVINSETNQPFPNVLVHIGEWPDGPFDGSELDTYAPENGEFVLKYAGSSPIQVGSLKSSLPAIM
jgi:hypothetical protein